MHPAVPPYIKVWRFTVNHAHKPRRTYGLAQAVLPNKQGSLFGLGGFRKARCRTFTVDLRKEVGEVIS